MTNVLERLKLVVQYKLYIYLLHFRKIILESLMGSKAKKRLMINIGGGLYFRPGWRVMDYVSPFYPFAGKYIDYNIDLMGKVSFPFEDNSVAVFYSSHTLEHIPQEFCQNILDEIHRCLEPGGVVRLTMPDYDILRAAALRNDEPFFESQMARDLTIEESLVSQIATDMAGRAPRDEVIRNFKDMTAEEFAEHYTSRASREVQKEKGGYHINWFNYDKLSAMAKAAGFENMYKSQAQGSKFADLVGTGGLFATGNIFDGERRLGVDTSHPTRSLYLEAVK